ncbi:hypothetical protein RJ43_08930 [Alteromonas macleodii]|uniref:sulfotransferase domain-containing protein n=1 Tax=Alteromonas macleodii TaxID=28108 RepID=UPI00057D27FF|nr:sulfotransferase domain-containing protein [Alteromonas macleodii]KHT54530.1 hypothetical protein RJ43_08930 [Alteromonas macleodii]
MSGLILANNLLVTSNHKCGSTALDSLFSERYIVKGSVNNGLQFDYSFQKKRHANLNSTPWKHAHADVWLKFLELKGLTERPKILTSVRNPWDRIVSLYHYNSVYKTNLSPVNFESFVRQFCADSASYDRFPDFAISRDGTFRADYVIRLENIEEELNNFFAEEKIDLKASFDMSNNDTINSSKRKKDYRAFYNDETAQLVFDYFKHEISNFEYSFDSVISN